MGNHSPRRGCESHQIDFAPLPQQQQDSSRKGVIVGASPTRGSILFRLRIPIRRETASRAPTVWVQLGSSGCPQFPLRGWEWRFALGGHRRYQRGISSKVERPAYTRQTRARYLHPLPFSPPRMPSASKPFQKRLDWVQCPARGPLFDTPVAQGRGSGLKSDHARAARTVGANPTGRTKLHRSGGHERTARLKPVCMRLQPPPLRPLPFWIVKRTSEPSLSANEPVPPTRGMRCKPSAIRHPQPMQIKVVYLSRKAREAGIHWPPFSRFRSSK